MTAIPGKPGKVMTIYAIVPYLIILLWGAFSTIGAAGNSSLYRPADDIYMQSDTAKILSILETRIDNKKILKKAKNKLPAMGRNQLQLLTTLCERIEKGDAAESNIAFSFVTLLIILS